jgi:hypothetical protein
MVKNRKKFNSKTRINQVKTECPEKASKIGTAKEIIKLKRFKSSRKKAGYLYLLTPKGIKNRKHR